MRRVTIGLLGCGTVGAGFVGPLDRERERIREREGFDLEIQRILVRDPSKVRPGIRRELLTDRAIEVLDDGCELIVELVGGVHSAGAFVRRALGNGRNVVTANKALLAESGPNCSTRRASVDSVWDSRPASAAPFRSSGRWNARWPETKSWRSAESSTGPAITF
jgi:Homoserine dehydrogenase